MTIKRERKYLEQLLNWMWKKHVDLCFLTGILGGGREGNQRLLQSEMELALHSDRDIEVVGVFSVFNWFFYELWYRYDYVQQRRETLTILYDYQVQQLAQNITQLDLGSVTLRDLLTMYYPNPVAAPAPDAFGNYLYPWDPYIKVANFNSLAKYQIGDYVVYGGAIYQCQNANVQGDFWEYGVTQFGGLVSWGTDGITFTSTGNQIITKPAGITNS